MSRSNFNIAESVLRWFGMFCVAGWARKIEAEVNRAILSPPFTFTLDVSSLTRGDPKTVYANYQSARAAGWMTANEIRQRENLPPRDDGDSLVPPAQSAAGSGSASSSDAPSADELETDEPPDDTPPASTSGGKARKLNGHDHHA